MSLAVVLRLLSFMTARCPSLIQPSYGSARLQPFCRDQRVWAYAEKLNELIYLKTNRLINRSRFPVRIDFNTIFLWAKVSDSTSSAISWAAPLEYNLAKGLNFLDCGRGNILQVTYVSLKWRLLLLLHVRALRASELIGAVAEIWSLQIIRCKNSKLSHRSTNQTMQAIDTRNVGRNH